jgi:putative tricarboxylic transport membrane protein
MIVSFKKMGIPVLIFSFFLFFPGESPAQKFLNKPVEFVVHAAAGGGSDIMARMMASMIEKEKMMPVPVAVVNRPGGSSAVANAYVAGKKGDPHFWLTATTSFIQTPLQGKSKYHYKDFTPLTNLAYDDFLVIVKADSPYNSMKDLVAGAKKNPGQLKVGGTHAPGVDAVIAFLIEKETGTKFNYIPFKSGGEVMVALLGGHVELAMANPGEALAQMEAKKVKVLGATTSQRLSLAPDIPTLKEQGINVVFQQFRSIAAPQDISAEAVKYYEGVFKKLSESSLWKEKYIRENMLTPDYTTSAETFQLWEAQSNMYAKIMKEMGIIK